MTILEELRQYSNDCINDTIPSCKKHKWACERFLRDLEKEWDYHWDEAEAEKIVKWFSYLRHSKGVLAGKPIELTAMQKFFLCQIYGWRDENGNRRFNKSFLELARKNAKSQMESGVALYELSVTSVKNKELNEVYCAGVKREQSKIVFEECKNMLKGSPLSTKFHISRDAIKHEKSGSFMKPLSKEDGKKGDGTNPALLVIDEFHQHQTTEFYDLGLGANTKEPLLMIITTAGMDLNCPCYQQEYKMCSQLLNPDYPYENDKYFADIFEADEGDKPDDLNTWIKANPIRATYAEGIEKLTDEYKIAEQVPEKMTAFMTKCLDTWVQAKEHGYMDMGKWNKCLVDESPIDTRGMSVMIGFDMSCKIDLTSVAFIIPYLDGKDKKYLCYSHSFIPNTDKLMERIQVDHQPYDAWVRQGFITICDTPIIDQNTVMEYVLKTVKENGWEIDTLCFDPANASKIMMDLSNEGYDVEEVYQSHKSLNESTAGYREEVYSGNIVCLNNPVLNFAMANAVTRVNNGLIKIDKDATRFRIDPVDAMLCAYKLARYYEFGDIFSSDEWLDSEDW